MSRHVIDMLVLPQRVDCNGLGDLGYLFKDLNMTAKSVATADGRIHQLDKHWVTHDPNVGSILGNGFPDWNRGGLQYTNQYVAGPAGFVAKGRELAEKYGARFAPPASLVALAETGGERQ